MKGGIAVQMAYTTQTQKIVDQERLWAKKEVFDFIDEHKVNQGSHFMLDEEDYQRFKKDSLNSKKVTLWCSEHGDQEGNVCKKCLSANSKTKPQCKFLYADWCHNPTVGQQEKCFFYHNNHNCKHYATNSKKEQDDYDAKAHEAMYP